MLKSVKKSTVTDIKHIKIGIGSLYARKVFKNFLTKIAVVSRLSLRFTTDNFLKFSKTFLGLLKIPIFSILYLF